MRKKFAVFISGYGRGAIEIIKDHKKGLIYPELSLILSNNSDSFALKVAKKYKIPAQVIERERYINKEEFEKQILTILKKYCIEYIFLAGWKEIKSPYILSRFPEKVINIHPSLLPSFKGLNAIDQALNYGVRITGVTTHFIDSSIDGGKIIDQVSVRIYKNDDFVKLDKKLFKAGSKLSIRTINKIFV